MPTVPVALGNRSYPIQIGTGILPTLGRRLAKLGLARRCALIADTQVAPLYAETLLTSLREAGFDPLLVNHPAGEKAKDLRVVGRCLDQLAAHRLERKSVVIALGGGVTGDLAGFVAACFLRGVAFVQVPTTLLAQVDSSVGGKVGVNLAAGKNLVGAFLQPRLVLCDLGTLSSLPEREFRAGLAEAIKYGVIADAALFRRLRRDLPRLLARDPAVLGPVVARCCAIKAEVVAEDETETGRRAILNFGHTVGHGLEAITRYGEFLHGEAISVGQGVAAVLSQRLLGFPAQAVVELRELLRSAGLPVTTPFPAARRRRLREAMSRDKKVRDGEVRFVLSPRIGESTWGVPVPAAELDAALDEVASWEP